MNSCKQMVNSFYSDMSFCLDHFIPVIRTTADNLNKPWVTKAFQDLIKQRQRAFMGSQTELYRKVRNKVNRMATLLHKKYYARKTDALHTADPCSWWQKTKQFLYSKHTNPLQNLQQQNPQLSIADEINGFFVSLSAHLPPFDQTLLDSLANDYSDQYIIEPAEVERQLLRINTHKSSGPDGLPNWLLKEFASIINEPLTAIFNASLREGYFPPIWKSLEVVPVPKINPPSSIYNDLRPISLLPTLAKVFKSIVDKQLLVFFGA